MHGCTGPWFPCRRDLRQGDPLSPYLFLLVADVLQRLIRSDDSVLHPLTPAHCAPSCNMHADDTLIVMKADAGSVVCQKLILDFFAEATGLKINYSKRLVGTCSR